MAITTYAELQTAVANWLHRADLTSAIPDFITLCETEIFRHLRTRDNEVAFSGTIDTATNTLALPTSYIDLKYAYVSTTPVQWLDRQGARMIRQEYPYPSAVGVPKFIAREGSNFIFGPTSDAAYTVAGVYYKNLGPLSSSAHAIFTNNPDLYLYGSLLAAVPYIKNDSRVPLWQAAYERCMATAQSASDREQFSGSPLRVVTS